MSFLRRTTHSLTLKVPPKSHPDLPELSTT